MFDKRAPLATKSLQDLGYKNVVNLNGGSKAWKEAGYPLETGGKGYYLEY